MLSETVSRRVREVRNDRLRPRDIIVIAAVALHGPVDILLTLSAMELESNPIVLALGWGPWIAVKAAVLIAFGVVYLVARDHDLAAYAAVLTAVVGAVALLNIAVISGVIG